jgi:hypothetical protein
MDFNFRIIQAKDFLIASPEGKFDFDNAKKLLLKLARENATAGQFDILLDIRGAAFDSLSFADITDLVQVMIDNRAEQMEREMEKRQRPKEKALRDKAQIAFIAAGGAKGDFAREWPSVFLEEVRGARRSDAASG